MNYPQVITLKDGHNETLLSVRDFEYLVDKYMGFEALRFFISLVQEYENDEISDILEYRMLEDSLTKTIDHLRQQIRELGGEPD